MNEHDSEWATSTIDEIATSIQYGHTASANDNRSGPRFLRITDIQGGQVNWESVPSCDIKPGDILKYRLQAGDIVFARTGATTGKSYLLRDCPEAVFASYLIRLRMHDGVFAPFVQAFFQSNDYWRQIEGGKRGIGQPNVNASVLGTIRIPLAPQDEQRRIVAKIDELFSELDAGVAALKRVQANLKRYRSSVLKAAVEGRLTEAWRNENRPKETGAELLARILKERRRRWEEQQRAAFAAKGKEPPKNWQAKYVEPAAADTSNLPALPKSWCWASLDSVADVTGGLTKDQKRATQAGVQEIPYLRVANVQRGFLDLGEMKLIHASKQDILALLLLPGDVLFTEGGDRDKLGRGWVWAGELPECIHQNHIFRARLFSNDMEPRLLSHHGNSFGKEWFTKAGKQTTNLASINLGMLRQFPIPVAPGDEQRELVATLDRLLSNVDEAEKEVLRGLARTSRLRESILKQAFEGKLVAQNTDDEPATALLARIQAQRERQRHKGQEDAAKKSSGVKRTEPKGIYFRRGAVASYVVRRLAASPEFGRTQLEKALYLTQCHLKIDLALEFERQKAGPFDKSLYKLEGVAKKAGWFTALGKRHEKAVYQAGPKIDERCRAAVAILGERQKAMDELLDHFAKMNTDQAELLATVHAAWNDLLLDGRAASNEAIVKEVRGWHPSKLKFQAARIAECVGWMRKHGYVPDGKGARTTTPKRQS